MTTLRLDDIPRRSLQNAGYAFVHATEMRSSLEAIGTVSDWTCLQRAGMTWSWTHISPTADGTADAGTPFTPSRPTGRSSVNRISRTIRASNTIVCSAAWTDGLHL